MDATGNDKNRLATRGRRAGMLRSLLLLLYDWVAGIVGDGPNPGPSVLSRYAFIQSLGGVHERA